MGVERLRPLFGGFLMLGGRVADKLGRRRVFVIGVVLFTLASLFCGLATSSAWLVTSRAVQGLGAAILSPAALDPYGDVPRRTRAKQGVEHLGCDCRSRGRVRGPARRNPHSGDRLAMDLLRKRSHRLIGGPGQPLYSGALAVRRREAGFDLPGALTLTAGLVLMVFVLVKSTSWGWASVNTIGTVAVALVLLAAFILIERRTTSPLVPLSIFGNRSLSVSNLASLAMGASIFSMFYFLSLYMQQVLGYSALRTGVGYLTIAFAIIIAAGAAQALVARLGVRTVMTVGMVLASGGLVYFTQISPHGTYLGTLLPGFLLAGVGLGLSFVPVTIGAVSGVVADEAGVASGLITTTQQVGGALGVAVLSTIAVSATTRFARSHGHGHQEVIAGLNHGFSTAFWFGAAFAAVGAVIALFGMSRSDASATAIANADGASI